MLGDTLTVTLGGSGGTARVCNKINQYNYSSEYLNQGTGDEVRVKVRHTKENPGSDGRKLDRHNVEITQTVYAVPDTSPEYRRVVSYTVRNFPDDTAADVVDVGEAMSYIMDDTLLTGLNGWES
jgi:hypothetical protein